MKILSVIIIIFGFSAGIQSFRIRNTLYEILKAGRDPESLKSTIWKQRLISISCLLIGFYILF